MQRDFIISIGPPSCGKSYWYNCLKKKSLKVALIDFPAIRSQTNGDSNDLSQEDMVNKIAEMQLRSLLSNNIDIIVWENSLTYKDRRNIIKLAKASNYNVIGILFDISIETCKMRNRLKEIPLLESHLEEINSIIKKNEPDYSEGFDEILIIKE